MRGHKKIWAKSVQTFGRLCKYKQRNELYAKFLYFQNDNLFEELFAKVNILIKQRGVWIIGPLADK